nr:GDP-mannose transporter GONST3-like [Populus alba]
MISKLTVFSQMSADVENPKAEEKQKDEIPATWYTGFLKQTSIYAVAVGYCISASLLSIINKWALTALQYFTSVAGVPVCGWCKFLEHDSLNLLTMWRFVPLAIMFYLSLFTNSELLLHANVDNFIVFRS